MLQIKIQHNLAAINAYRQNEQTGKLVSKSFEKLSSGQRINRAADDAAGAAISEKMRGQIRGLAMAKKNIEDGISLVQTAEAGIGSIQNPYLARMRELVIQAANDPLTESDRAIIQQEIKQLAAGIHDVATKTEFNTQPLLGPSKVMSSQQSTQEVDIVFFIDDSGSMGNSIDLVRQGLNAFMANMNQYGDVKIGTTSIVPGRSDRDLALTSNIEEAKAHLRDKHIADGGLVDPYAKLLDFSDKKDFGFREGSQRVFIILTDTDLESSKIEDKELVAQSLEDQGIQTYLFGLNFYGGANHYPNQPGYDFVQGVYRPNTPEEVAENISPGLADAIIAQTPELEKGLKELIFQIGPNTGQTVAVNLFDVRAATLHVAELEVSTYEEAMGALRRIDQANNQLSSHRSYYGSLQNRLEHTLQYVMQAGENMTNSLSRLADTDLAKEYQNLTKSQILLQSAQAMSVQANQLGQQILSFLK